MLPDIPGLGVWRVESHGYNAAVELPTTLEVLVAAAREHKFIPAVLTIQQRTKKIPGEGTRRFIVPAITLPNVTVQQIANGNAPLALNAPQPNPPRPELPAAAALPADAAFAEVEEGEWGEPPEAPPDEQTELTGRLLAVADRIGVRDTADEAIARNREKNAEQSDKHLTWLRGQVTRLEKQAEGVSA
jgi:hypothetical protein